MFKKFLSIENSRNFKDKYVITEKIDGANIQFIFENGELTGVASRNQIVENNFNGYQDVIKKPEFQVLFEKLKELSKNNAINIYGEIFSNSVQKRIKYGIEPQIRFFSISVNDKYYSFKVLQDIVENDRLLVPIITYTNTLEESFSFDVDNLKSRVAPEEQIAEGIVVEPFLYFDERRMVKIKSKNFLEIEKNIKKQQNIPNQDVISMRDNFLNYLTENRLDNVCSHYDCSNMDKELAIEIVRDFFIDAKNDFLKENDLSAFSKEEQKFIFKQDFSKWLNVLTSKKVNL